MTGGDSYRFTHVLAREAAYHGTPSVDRTLGRRRAGEPGGDSFIGFDEVVTHRIDVADAF